MSTTSTLPTDTDRLPLRKRFGRFFKNLTTPRPPVVRTRARAPPRNDQFHYVISAVQEDEIRESFLVEKLRGYTLSLSESDFESIVMDKSDADDSIEEGSDKEVDDYEAENGFISVPFPGTKTDDSSTEEAEKSSRKVPNNCAICLSSFEPEDRVTWSSNKDCTHVFHDACIVDWLNSSGRRHLRRKRRQGQQDGVLNYAHDPLRKITKFPMPCPCCRQEFALCCEINDDGSPEEQVTTAPATQSPDPAAAPSVVDEEHLEETELVESAASVDDDSDELDDARSTTSCVELSASDEAASDDDECSTDSITMTAAMACPITA